ncbi:MAG: hypothetical protein C0404_07580 [Verrucomicrobia bacterium]|nr:hypothetical protein [Verrucomicrobiota bacterium]
MHKPFRLRYANEIAGSFVLLAVLLLVAGVFATGRAQGWFEGKFKVVSVFLTDEGAYGLQEDSVVKVRNTVAGRVVRITPTEQGHLKVVFEIKERFHSFVTVDSVVKVKKKFGVGDSFVEIEMGKGRPVQDGATILTAKEEDVADAAKKALKNIQDAVVPMFDEVQQILKNVNGIVGSVNKGEGIAGTVINDPKFAGEIKDVVLNVNGLLVNSQETAAEITRLVKGAQQHWLLKKYVDEIKETEFVSPVKLTDGELGAAIKRYRHALNNARAADDSVEICRNAHNLAVCMLLAKDYGRARDVLRETRIEAGAKGDAAIRAAILEAELTRRTGTQAEALSAARHAVGLLDKSASKELELEARVLVAEILCDMGKAAEATAQMKEVRSPLRKTESASIKASVSRVDGKILMLQDDPVHAAGNFDQASELLRTVPAYSAMAGTLEDAGKAYAQVGNSVAAADRYFRSGRTLYMIGHTNAGERAFALARAAATDSGNASYVKDMTFLCDLIVGSSSAASAGSPARR